LIPREFPALTDAPVCGDSAANDIDLEIHKAPIVTANT
ncbi:MAG: hypothetical protein RLZZ419_1729, partial [Pseudomonadota bacterium]|jgi:hypothetical protein